MSEEEIRKVVLEALGEVVPEADVGALEGGADLRDQLDVDSMDLLNFVIGMHERLQVDIPEADYAALATLDGCVAYLKSKLAARQGA
jgi:acyl carrier protein